MELQAGSLCLSQAGGSHLGTGDPLRQPSLDHPAGRKRTKGTRDGDDQLRFSANRYMQAEVLPEPTAPTITTPVYSAVSDITSQDGRSPSYGAAGWQSSPTTTEGPRSPGDAGHGGSLPPAASSHPRLQPDPPDREAEAPGEQYGYGGGRVVPDADRRVEGPYRGRRSARARGSRRCRETEMK